MPKNIIENLNNNQPLLADDHDISKFVNLLKLKFIDIFRDNGAYITQEMQEISEHVNK